MSWSVFSKRLRPQAQRTTGARAGPTPRYCARRLYPDAGALSPPVNRTERGFRAQRGLSVPSPFCAFSRACGGFSGRWRLPTRGSPRRSPLCYPRVIPGASPGRDPEPCRPPARPIARWRPSPPWMPAFAGMAKRWDLRRLAPVPMSTGRSRPRNFPFLPFLSKGCNFLPKRLPKISIAFKKLQKISAIRDLSMGYGRAKGKTNCQGREGPTVVIARSPKGDAAIQGNKGRSTFPWIATPPKPVERRASFDALRRLAMTAGAADLWKQRRNEPPARPSRLRPRERLWRSRTHGLRTPELSDLLLIDISIAHRKNIVN